jgi:hypothetical protein
MSDLIYLGVIVGFFALAYGLLRACERIIGPDPATSTTNPADASVPSTPSGETLEVTA